MRDDKWLKNIMFDLWESHFVDTPRTNRVIIKFGNKAKRQLGCIKWVTPKTKGIAKYLDQLEQYDDPRISLIVITSYFKDERIPEDVVRATIAHEMCHYAHGFNSPLHQLYDHPHKGGVIRREMAARGLGDMYRNANRWLRINWAKYLKYYS